MDWDRKELRWALEMKADLLNMQHLVPQNKFLAYLRGDNEPSIDNVFQRLHSNLNAIIDAMTNQRNELFNGPAVRRITADEIKKQLKEKNHGG